MVDIPYMEHMGMGSSITLVDVNGIFVRGYDRYHGYTVSTHSGDMMGYEGMPENGKCM